MVDMNNGEYQRQVDDLVPEAWINALNLVRIKGKTHELRKGVDGSTYHHCFTSQFFHIEMARLTREAGLR
jgi:hypothetical protein